MRNTNACLCIFTVILLFVPPALSQKKTACQRPSPGPGQGLVGTDGPGTTGPGAGTGTGNGRPVATTCNQTLTCDTGRIVIEEVSYHSCAATDPCCCASSTSDSCLLSRWDDYDYMGHLADACVGETHCVPYLHPCCCTREPDGDSCVTQRWEDYDYMRLLADVCVGEPHCDPPPYSGDSTGEMGTDECPLGIPPKTQRITYSCVPNTRVINVCTTINENSRASPFFLAYNSKVSPRDKSCGCTLALDEGEDEDIEVVWLFGSSACVRTTLKMSWDDDAESQMWECRDDISNRNIAELRGMHVPRIKGKQLDISLDHLYAPDQAGSPEKLWIALKIPGGESVNINCGSRQTNEDPSKPTNTDKFACPEGDTDTQVDNTLVIVKIAILVAMAVGATTVAIDMNMDKFASTEGDPDTSVDNTVVAVIVAVLVVIAIGAAILAVVFLRWRRSKRQRMDSTRRRAGDAYIYPDSDVAYFDYTGSISRQGSTYATINDLHIDNGGDYARISIKSTEYNKADLKYKDVALDPSYSRLQSRDSYSRIKDTTSDKKEVVSDDYSHTQSTELSGDYNHTTDRVTSSGPSADYSHIHVKDAHDDKGNTGDEGTGECNKLQDTSVRNGHEQSKHTQDDNLADEGRARQVDGVPTNNGSTLSLDKISMDSANPEDTNVTEAEGDHALQLPRKRSSSSSCSSLSSEDFRLASKNDNMDTDTSIRIPANELATDGYETAIKSDVNGTGMAQPGFKVLDDGYETAIRDDGNDTGKHTAAFKLVNDGYETAIKGDDTSIANPAFKVVNDGYETALRSDDNDTGVHLPTYKDKNDGYETAIKGSGNDTETVIESNATEADEDKPGNI